MASSTLETIQTKVRRLTRSLSEAQLSTTQLDDYINTFILYDLPEHLRLFNLKETFSFYTEPYVDVYETSTDTASPLYNFKNRFTSILPPFYIGGWESQLSESRTEFFRVWSKLENIASIGSVGDGVTTKFTGSVTSLTNNGTLTSQTLTILRNDVLFTSIDSNNNGLVMIDYPISANIGNLYVPGGAPTSTTTQDPDNYINYTTGQFVVEFGVAPGASQSIKSQTVVVQPSRPTNVLYFDGKFTLRPVPDQVYKVTMDAFVRPTELLAGTEPKLSQWWQYIAYGAARKVFQDRMDSESLAVIDIEFNKQELLVNRSTIVQQTSQRTSTIYQGQTNGGLYGQWSNWFSGNNS